MKAEAVAAGRRLALGTGNGFEWLGHWLGAESRIPEQHTLLADLAWLGVALRRLVLLALAGIFYANLLLRAPHLVYLVPVVWAVGAWQMSDWSATPPPEEGRPSCRECAGHELVSVTPLESQKGMLIYTSAPPDRPNYTHVHIAEKVTTS